MVFAEVILLLLGLSNFSLQPNPRPPTADAALQYAVPDADVTFHLDAASFVPNNYRTLLQIANQPQIKSSPELAKLVRAGIAEIEGMRGIARSTVGIDPTTDIADATAFFQLAPQQQPAFVVAVHGRFTIGNLEKIAKLSGGQVARVGGGALVELGPTQPALALTRDGVLLAGTPRLVRDRVAPGWRAPARPAGSSLAYAAELVSARPVYGMVVTLSPTARKALVAELGPSKNFATDLIQRHRAFSFGLFHDGVGWTWVDRDRSGLEQIAQMSEGALELMRAAQIAPRGMAKLAIGALESYRGTDKRLDEVIRRKADILKIVEAYTGDGNFKVQLDKKPAALRLDVRATGRSLSEVVPAGALVPLGVIGWLTATRGRAEPLPPPAMPAQRARPAPRKPAPARQAHPAGAHP